MLELKTLGHSTVYREGAELSGITAQKQRFAILVYLAVERRVARDRLLAMFWPDRQGDRARHSLSQALYALRRDLQEDCVLVQGDLLSISDTACAVDVNRLEAAATAQRWEDVVDLYGGQFLADFALGGAPEFEKWQSSMRTRVARTARHAFRRVVEAQMAAGNQTAALEVATKWATQDPLEDEAQHTLIALLARSGNRSAAIKQYETYRALLAKELDVEPLEGTVALINRIRAGELPEYRPLSAAHRPPAAQQPAPPSAEAAEVPEPPQHFTMASLLSELRKRRVFHIGAAYLAVAWLAIQFTGTVVEHAILPDWVFRVVLFFLFLGFPFAVILAWAQEPAGGAKPPAGERWVWPAWAARVSGSNVFWFLTILVVALGGAWIAVEQGLSSAPPLDDHAIVIFPLDVSPEGEGNDLIGENLATSIGTTLENAGQFRYEDPWWAAGLQNDLSERSAIRTAQSLGAGYYLRGHIALDEADSALIVAELHDVSERRLLTRIVSNGPIEENWLKAQSQHVASEIMAALLPDEDTIELAFPSEMPQARSEYLAGERSYRRAQFAEALRHYKEAVRLDSTFAYAALKGYLAATWEHDNAAADTLLEVAARRQAFLEPSRSQFVQGLAAYWEGRADDASRHFKQAISIAPNWLEAWAQLGELYYHFLPSESPLDSLAEAAFEQVRRRDATFAPVLYHLIQLAVRRRDFEGAEELLADFQRAQPDTSHTWLTSDLLLYECATRSPDLLDWRARVHSNPSAVYQMAQAAAVGAEVSDCARAGWTAIIEHDTATDDEAGNRRLWSIIGLQSLLVAEARYDAVRAVFAMDTVWDRLEGDLYILATVAGAELEPEAMAEVDALRRRIRESAAGHVDFWMLGIWEAYKGRADEVRALADTLSLIAEKEHDRSAALLARSLEARALLTAGDSAGALGLLSVLVPTKRRLDPWYMWESLPYEQLALAELLYANGRYEEALGVAANFDAPARPTTDLAYLPASLELRISLARRLGDTELERHCLERLRALGRDDLLDQ